MSIITRLLRIFDRREKTILVVLLFMALLGAGFETVSIGALLPFIQVLTNPSSVQQLPIVGEYTAHMSEAGVVIAACIGLMAIFIVKGLYLVFQNYAQARFVFRKQAEFSVRLLDCYLHKPFSFFFTKNVAEVQRNVNTSVIAVMQGVVLTSLSLVCEVCVSLMIFSIMLVADPFSTLVLTGGMGGLAYVIFKKQSKTIKKIGAKQQEAGFETLKWINQSVQGIKDIKIRENYTYYTKKLEQASSKYADAAITNTLLTNIPKASIEFSAIFGLTALLFINLLSGKDMSAIFPVVTLFAVGAYRLMPSVNRIVSYINGIHFYLPALDEIDKDLVATSGKEIAVSESGDETWSFASTVLFDHVSYSYNEENPVLRDVCMEIRKGEWIGIMGASGQGKTTLVDLLLGLLPPQEGRLCIDGQDIADMASQWHSKISYVPQTTMLLDDSILKNIVIDAEIDREKVSRVLADVGLLDDVTKMKDGLDTQIGDNGICLSGGQRQRISIARALYRNPEVIVFDEATSALDKETARSVMSMIRSISHEKTLLFISHTEEALEQCDRIMKVDKQKVTEVSRGNG